MSITQVQLIDTKTGKVYECYSSITERYKTGKVYEHYSSITERYKTGGMYVSIVSS